VDCKLAPPRVARPAPHGGPRSRRCATHQRAHTKAQRLARAEKRVQSVYGLGPGEYDRLLAFQGGTCAFPNCRARGGGRRRLAVDHDHDTGAVRGILCQGHNYLLLGRFVNDLQDGLDYLASPPYERMKGASTLGRPRSGSQIPLEG
jgi:Recombination endonuclease VII